MTALTQNKFLTNDEISKLLRVLHNHRGERNSILIRVAFYTGARPSEILAITTDDLSQNQITIKGLKGSNNRTVPVPPAFYRELINYVTLQHTVTYEPIFPIKLRMYQWVWDQYRPSKKGLKSLRHTFGVKLYHNCRDVMKVKYMLGHVSISNTMVYLDYVESNVGLKKAIKGMWSKSLDIAA